MTAHPEIDPAYPERRLDIFIAGHCGACRSCWVDRRNFRCSCGGPYNINLERDPPSFQRFSP